MGHKPRTSMARYDGRDAVVLLARPKTDIDVLATANTIQDLVDQFDAAGEGVQVGTVRSQGREIDYMLRMLSTSAVYGTVLVIVVLCVTMGWRNAGLISFAVPFAILGTGAIMWFAKRTFFPDLAINNMLMFAMILVVGMVVDGGIIVGENIYRHRELGRSPQDAAKRGIAEVGPSLMAAYMTTFSAFTPMFLVGSVMGDFLQVLPTVVMFALCSAMLVDHFLLPVISVYLMKPSRKALQRMANGSDALDTDDSMTPQQREIANAQAVANATRVRRGYGAMLRFAMHNRLLVLVLTVITATTPVAMFMIGAVDFEFFPETDFPVVEVYFELPLGSSMEYSTVKVAQQIEQAVLRAVEPHEWYQPSLNAPPARPVTTIGKPGELNIRLDNDQGTGPEFGMVYVELSLAEDRDRTSMEIRDAIARAMPPMPGVIVKIKSPKEGPPHGCPGAGSGCWPDRTRTCRSRSWPNEPNRSNPCCARRPARTT